MKTRITVEIETKDELIAMVDMGLKTEQEANVAEDVHKGFVRTLKEYFHDFDDSDLLMDGLEDAYIENLDELEDYGFSIKVVDIKKV